jgi:hypothetical protein
MNKPKLSPGDRQGNMRCRKTKLFIFDSFLPWDWAFSQQRVHWRGNRVRLDSLLLIVSNLIDGDVALAEKNLTSRQTD